MVHHFYLPCVKGYLHFIKECYVYITFFFLITQILINEESKYFNRKVIFNQSLLAKLKQKSATGIRRLYSSFMQIIL